MVFQYEHYTELANKQHLGYIKLEAQRGEILVEDTRSATEFPLASNITLDHLFIDPFFMIEQGTVDDFINYIVPVIYTEKQKRIQSYIDERQAIDEYAKQRGAEEKRQELIKQGILTQSGFTLSGITLEDLVEFDENKEYAEWEEKWLTRFQLSFDEQVQIYQEEIRDEIDLKAESRYFSILKKLPIPLSQKIAEIKEEENIRIKGMVLQAENHRYYPEGSVASNILGYVDQEGEGQYGLEGQYNYLLAGKDGKMFTEKDSMGRTISIQGETLEESLDGADILLTIDRAAQMELEKILERRVNELDADYADAIVMNPDTGEIIAMAEYPNFNPNEYTKVFERVPIYSTDWIEEQNRQIPVITDDQ